jgi:phosphoribosylglycinamide formyltransferase-1
MSERSPHPKKRVAVLVSGRGSNLQALIDAAHAPGYPGAIVLVLSNRSDAYALTRACEAGIATAVLRHGDFANREALDAAIDKTLGAHAIDVVCLAGFMRILTPGFVAKWQGKMINIHPSLLPKFKGLDTHARVLEARETEHGCTVHWVVPELDSGEIIAQARVPVLPGDTPETLAARVLAEENRIYPEALRKALIG